MEEFLAKELTVQIGKFYSTWQLRGDMWGAGTFENIFPYTLNQAFVLDGAAVGIGFYYDATEQVTLTFIWHKLNESNLPTSSDLDLLAIRIDYTIEGSNKVFGAFMYINDQGEAIDLDPITAGNQAANIWMLNAGIDYFLMEEEALELYFELVYQAGDAATAGMDLGTLALNLGAEFTFSDIETVPYIGLDVTFVQGQDGTTYAYNMLFNNWTKTLIAESDFRNNNLVLTPGYMGVKLVGGMKNIMDEKIMIDFVFAWFKADGDVPVNDGIGFEIDAVASYWYTEDVVFTLGLGYFVPDEDLAGFADPDAVMMAIFACTITF
jgi:hypothetical protein